MLRIPPIGGNANEWRIARNDFRLEDDGAAGEDGVVVGRVGDGAAGGYRPVATPVADGGEFFRVGLAEGNDVAKLAANVVGWGQFGGVVEEHFRANVVDYGVNVGAGESFGDFGEFRNEVAGDGVVGVFPEAEVNDVGAFGFGGEVDEEDFVEAAFAK